MPEFKRWFGSSKVVDETGKPMLMYHGTSADQDFTQFDVGRRGAWFSRWTTTASDYAVDNDSPVTSSSAPRVIPVYLKIERPYTATEDDLRRVGVRNYADGQAALFDEIRAMGYDGVKWSPSEYVVLGGPEQIKSAIGNNGDFDPSSPDITKAIVWLRPIGARRESASP